jgi:uncharacterized protein (DUF302 family)
MSEQPQFTVQMALPFTAAVSRTREALKAEGFGILTEIDLAAAFHDKLGREFRPYVILGACNPPLAFAAVSADPSVGLLLPCNVTVEAAGAEEAIVRLTDPEALLGGRAVSQELRQVAADARTRLLRVQAVLAAAAA